MGQWKPPCPSVPWQRPAQSWLYSFRPASIMTESIMSTLSRACACERNRKHVSPRSTAASPRRIVSSSHGRKIEERRGIEARPGFPATQPSVGGIGGPFEAPHPINLICRNDLVDAVVRAAGRGVVGDEHVD